MKLDWNWTKKLPAFLKRYRYPALILLLGLGLMLWPGRSVERDQAARPASAAPLDQPETEIDYCKRMESKLAGILSEIDGAGQVRVMLTLRSTGTTRYQTNEESQTLDEDGKNSTVRRTETVLLSKGSSYNEPAVVRQSCPDFQGALVVSQGGDNASVRYLLARAVAALLGIGTDQVTVVKMK